MRPGISADEMQGKLVWIIGMGRSGLAAARLLKKLGADVFVTERRPYFQVKDELRLLNAIGAEYQVGGHQFTGRRLPDFAIASPGIDTNAPIIGWMRHRGLPIYSEVEVASWFYYGTVIAITGSNGKTTVTSWIAHILKQAGLDAVAAGNIGYPFSDLVRERPTSSHAVVEVSSYQLETILGFHPYVSVITNITNDHLERHGSMDNYARTKARIFENQVDDDWAVLPGDDTLIGKISTSIKPQIAYIHMDRVPVLGAGIEDDALWLNLFGKKEKLVERSELPLVGMHNAANALCASAACSILQLTPEEIREGLLSFRGVPHRLELISRNGRNWINDSKATNVDSLRVALEAVEPPIYLIAGGQDKGAPYTPLRELVREKVDTVYLIGEAMEAIESELGDVVKCVRCETLPNAVQIANASAPKGANILLSPACASFDQFDNFEQRGDFFRKLIREAIIK